MLKARDILPRTEYGFPPVRPKSPCSLQSRHEATLIAHRRDGEWVFAIQICERYTLRLYLTLSRLDDQKLRGAMGSKGRAVLDRLLDRGDAELLLAQEVGRLIQWQFQVEKAAGVATFSIRIGDRSLFRQIAAEEARKYVRGLA